MLTILWWSLVVLLLVFGFVGCFVNKVPGPIAVVLATILGITCIDLPITWATVGILSAMAIASMIASKVLVKMVQKLQEYSKKASWGTTIGSLAGLAVIGASTGVESVAVLILIMVAALVVIPFVLAFLLELTNKQGAVMALKCAASATGAYVADTFLKLIVFVYAVYVMFFV